MSRVKKERQMWVTSAAHHHVGPQKISGGQCVIRSVRRVTTLLAVVFVPQIALVASEMMERFAQNQHHMGGV